MLDKFTTYLAKNQLIPAKSTTLLAISGGVDSVVLAYLFKKAGLNFAISHCHFDLRSQSADDDQNFVYQLAKKYEVPFFTKKFDTQSYAKQHKLSIQMAARDLRYTWLKALLAQHGLGQIATGHHVGDELETFLYNVAKGTSIAGLHGILPKQGSIIRPLGFATKTHIIQYAKSQKLSWREDSTNTSLKYQRNWLRHKVIPPLKKLNPNLENTFITTLTKLRQVEAVFNIHTAQLKKIAFRYKDPYYYLDLTKVNQKNCPTIIIFEWLRAFGFSFIALQKWWEKRPQPGKKLYTSTHWLLAERNYWIVGPRRKIQPTTCTLATSTQSLNTPQYALSISLKNYQGYQISMLPTIAALDASKLSFPLQLRPWQAGDTFFPLGMSHRKKVSDFLIDHKVPLHIKEQVNVLTSAHNIIWIVGYRIDDRFKLSNTTQKVYEISMLSKSKN